MSSPRVCVLRAPGTNCDPETAFAFEACGATVDRVHILRVLEQPSCLADYQVLCVPGGFSYGDDIGAGVIFSSHLHGVLADALKQFLTADKLMLGICNGFQVLLKAGVLPDGASGLDAAHAGERDTTLTWNDNGRYTALWVTLKTQNTKNVFLRNIDEIELPIAHAEGRIAVTDEAILQTWRQRGQVALCYQAPKRSAVDREIEQLPYPINPNGSFGNIAGLSDPTGRVLGLMPHPERFLHATQHPNWTRLKLRGEGAGMQVFRNAVEYFA